MIAAFETASSDGSVALAAPDGALIGVVGWAGDRRQGSSLLPRLLELLAEHRLTMAALRAVAVGTGPGSFTGLRAAMSLAKGFAFSLSLPLVGVPSLPAWLAAEPEAVAALARAGAREVYLLERGAPTAVLHSFDELAGLQRDAPLAVSAELASLLALSRGRPPLRAAAAVAEAAALRLAGSPSGDDLDALEPLYLRPPRGVPAMLP